MRSNILNLTPYNPGKTVEEIENEIGKPIIKLSSNESIWGPSPRVKETLSAALANINTYPDGAARALKKAISQEWGLSEDKIILGNGADELIFMLTSAFLDPGEEAIIPIPTFSEYAAAVTIVGGICCYVEQPSLKIELELLREKINKKTKMIFLCNPNNPTSTSFTHEELKNFLSVVPPNIVVILDEAYCHYSDDPDFPNSSQFLKDYNNLLILRTFSKVYGLAALRVGYAVGQKDLISLMEKVRQPFNINSLAQVAALSALQDTLYIQGVINETILAREWLRNVLLEMGREVLPSQANFVLLKTKKDASQITSQLVQKGILVRHTASFNLPQWIRITIGPLPVMKKLAEAIKVLDD